MKTPTVDQNLKSARHVAFTASILSMWGLDSPRISCLLNLPATLRFDALSEIVEAGVSPETYTCCRLLLEANAAIVELNGGIDAGIIFLNSSQPEEPFRGARPLDTLKHDPSLAGIMCLHSNIEMWHAIATARGIDDERKH